MPTTDPGSGSGTALQAAAPRGFSLDATLLKRLVIVNGLVPMALLVWDAFHQDLGANDVNFAIHTTGAVGLVLLMLTLAVTPIRRLTGWSVVIAARRPLGLLAFFYILAHFLIFFALDRDGSVESTVHEVLTRVYLQLGTIALVLMAALAITSTDGMVRRLGPKRWKLLHRLVYPVAILGVIHFLLLVKSDIRAPRAFAIVLGALLLYRVLRHYLDLRERAQRPARAVAAPPGATARKRRFWQGELRVARIFQETHDVRTFRLVAPDGGPLPFDYRAGQYLNLALDIDGKRVNRSYTIASSPTRGGHCELTIKRAADGYASHHMHDRVREGDLLRVAAPAGRFVFSGDEAERVLLIAGGVGITPLMSMLRALTDAAWPGQIYLAIAHRREADLIFADELRYLAARHPNLKLTVTLSQPDDGWAGARGYVSAELLRGLVPDLGARPIPVFLCGPEPMMVAVRRVLADLGVPDDAVATEAFVSPVAADAGASTIGAEDMPEAAPEAAGSVRFERAGLSVEVAPGASILEAAEDAGLALPYECRSGICGQCRTRLVSGRVTMATQDALTPKDREAGVILACQARPVGACVVDA